LLCGGSRAVAIVVVGEGVEVVGDGARWLEVGRGVVVVVVGEGSGMRWLSEVREASQCHCTHTPRKKKVDSSTRRLRTIKPIPLVVTRKSVP
jgi:hypothetical protein